MSGSIGTPAHGGCTMMSSAVCCNGLRFPFLSWGTEDRRPILLLHGFPQEPATWASVAEALAARGFWVVAPFQRGYAPSTRVGGAQGYTFAQFVDDALGIVDVLGLKRFDVAGFGVGGAQAWMLAAARPLRVRSLTSLRFPHPAAFALGIRTDPEQGAKWQKLQQQLGALSVEGRAAAMLADNAAGLQRFLMMSGLPDPFLGRYVRRLREPGALLGALSWEHAICLDAFAEVPPVTVPTFLIWSEGPALARTTIDTTREFVHAPYRQAAIPQAGNFILETSPASVIEPLLEHLLAS